METVVYGRLTIDVPWLLFRFAEACNTQACPVRLKRCPGSYRQYNATSQVDVLVECGGHGVCYRATPTCIESDPTCTAVCTCDAGYATSDCSLTSAQFAASQQIRSACFNALVRLGGEIVLAPSVDQCSWALHGLVSYVRIFVVGNRVGPSDNRKALGAVWRGVVCRCFCHE